MMSMRRILSALPFRRICAEGHALGADQRAIHLSNPSPKKSLRAILKR
jgi:hypothetical protein